MRGSNGKITKYDAFIPSGEGKGIIGTKASRAAGKKIAEANLKRYGKQVRKK